MTAALAQARQPDTRPLTNVALPVVAGAPKVWAGARVYLDVIAGGIRPGIAGNQNLFFAGDAQETVDNSGGSTTAPCLVRLPDELNCEWCDNSTASPVTTLFGLCYVDSDHSVSASPVGNSVAGRVWALDTVKGVLVQPLMSLLESYLGEESSPGGNAAFTASCVPISIHAYSGSGTGTIASTANGTIASQITSNGVALAVGSVFFLQAGLTGMTANLDAGPWQVTAVGSAGSKWSATRPSWWLTGDTAVVGASVRIGASDAVYNNTEWKVYTGGVIDTADVGLYVKQWSFQATLSSGTIAFAAGQPLASTSYPLTSGGSPTMGAGIFSATQSNIVVTLAVPGTDTGAFSFSPTNHSSTKLATAGYVGTAAAAAFAIASGMTTDTSDTSTVNVTIFNP